MSQPKSPVASFRPFFNPATGEWIEAKEFHEALAGLVADGKTTPRGAPKNPLQLGATFWHFRHESRVTSPPIWVQNMMLPPLSALAKAFGVQPYYARWDSKI